MPRLRLSSAPTGPVQALLQGLAGGVALLGLALLAAGATRLAGGDAEAVLGNTALVLGMATLGVSALLGGARPSRWMAYGPGGGEQARRRASADPVPGRGLLRLSVAVAGALPFVLSVVLAVAH
ncbi:MAG: hypothetical protein E6I76_04275 [Chloroflexi bacterium]|nr:MAG: hypothetical protein E6I76_04275 [Chloroflexota bacterium]